MMSIITNHLMCKCTRCDSWWNQIKDGCKCTSCGKIIIYKNVPNNTEK